MGLWAQISPEAGKCKEIGQGLRRRVSSIKSDGESCSGLWVRYLPKVGSFSSVIIDFSELRIIFRRWLNANLTIPTNAFSSQSIEMSSLRRSLITPDRTFGGGRKASGSIVNKYSPSYYACVKTLKIPYALEPGGDTIRSATSFWNIPIKPFTVCRCSIILNTICELIL